MLRRITLLTLRLCWVFLIGNNLESVHSVMLCDWTLSFSEQYETTLAQSEIIIIQQVIPKWEELALKALVHHVSRIETFRMCKLPVVDLL